ncbi:MAG: aminomethyl-transferring glycine dehydrogenase [Deltaproteobacteria bacterium]|nr:aminomethyl-transferring glycine dehydrogenase [Deltaproteobacteria bacterium]
MPTLIDSHDPFARRHIGPDAAQIADMLAALGFGSLEALTAAVVPANIRSKRALRLPAARSEGEALRDLGAYAAENQVFRTLVGMGYADTITPPVLLRNLIENPGWYTQYTPYQPEISQGRLECMLNFQTMVRDLTALDIANASLLDEATAAAEAMALSWGQQKGATKHNLFVVDANCHPQTIAVVRTRALPLHLDVLVTDAWRHDFVAHPAFGVLVQYPGSDGLVRDPRPVVAAAHAAGALVTMATDLLALVLLTPPGELGADIAIGNSQRFGVPLGFGGPHAAFMATKDAYKRALPGRLVGVSQDAHGKPALRLALQTREQHIRRDKATSNICTAQVLLANLAGLYACWHGPDGLRRIAGKVHALAAALAAGLKAKGFGVAHGDFFDTLRVQTGDRAAAIVQRAQARRFNLRAFGDGSLGVALDECSDVAEVAALLSVFTGETYDGDAVHVHAAGSEGLAWGALGRTSVFLTHPVFHRHHSETEMMRWLHQLQGRDLSLVHSMIPLGSCTMKLNAAAEMLPITWPGFGKLHPFAPAEQAKGYARLFADLEAWLTDITGFAACSLQPNAGSQGEYAGLQVIRAHLQRQGQGHRNVCLIPQSAHGTNPATAVMAGMQVVVVACDARGNVSLDDLDAKIAQHRANLAALMITYPSTHGVFEAAIVDICARVHAAGGQVYMDGANLNAQVGLCSPGEIGADVCHINLHKTFCIPHGGGGPGMGPICVAAHLADLLPGHPVSALPGESRIGPVSAAAWGSASILPISWMYIAMMGADGLRRATQVAILNANYVASKLGDLFPVLYTGEAGLVAHECILDTRVVKPHAEVDDIAKRLMDYGFHAPTMSFPVPGTLMVEPTESESKSELDRFVFAMRAIAQEAALVAKGELDAKDNPLKNAPHTLATVLTSDWTHPYSRETAAFPAPWCAEAKFWPAVGRIDNAYGDRNLMCACIPVEDFA